MRIGDPRRQSCAARSARASGAGASSRAPCTIERVAAAAHPAREMILFVCERWVQPLTQPANKATFFVYNREAVFVSQCIELSKLAVIIDLPRATRTYRRVRVVAQ